MAAAGSVAPVVHARLRREARVTSVTLVLAGVCFLAFCVSLSIGDVDIPITDVVRTLFGAGDASTSVIVNQLRLPRALVAVLAGAAFGLSGAIFQNLLRNPLARPDIIGITAGASAGAVIAILVVGLSGYAVSVAAFAGALGIAAAIYVLAWRDGVTGYRLVLVGIAMAAVMTSIVSYCLTTSEVYEARNALVWLTGSLNAMTWTTVRVLGWCLALLVPLALVAGRRLKVLQLGDDAARALGVPVERARLVGSTGIALVPAAAVGALVMTASDVVARHALASIEFPVGVVTAMVGAPYLLWLLAATNRGGRGG